MKTQKRFVISGMFKTLKFLGICLILIALFAPTAHAETIFVDPGAVDGEAQNFWFDNNPAEIVDLLWSDNKTLEWEAGTHLFLLAGTPCANYAGILLDEAGKGIPGTELLGKTQCLAGSELSSGVIDLPETTVFSGIRLSGAFNTDAGWQWNWNSADRPVVGQIDADGNQPPIAEAGADVTGQVGMPVAFNGSDSKDPDGTIDLYNWDFVETVANNAGAKPSHTFTASGTYNVVLYVSDNDGLGGSDSVTVTIAPNSTPPVADAGGPYTGVKDVLFFFDGSESDDPDGRIVQYDWDFGDGSIATDAGPAPENLYASSGEFFVTLAVTDNSGERVTDTATITIVEGNVLPVADAGLPVAGNSNEEVVFNGSGSSDPDGTIVKYDWNFGDGNSASGAEAKPSHVYTDPGDYTVYLAVTDNLNATTSSSTSASIDSDPLSPTAKTDGPYAGFTVLDVTFISNHSSDPDGIIALYEWDFGDNTTPGNGQRVYHAYAVPGSYKVTLQVTDDSGLTDTDTTQADIADGNEPPTADAGQDMPGKVNQVFTFNGSGSVDRDGTITSYDWDFADGSTGTGENPTHTYTAAGEYLVKLTVTDDAGDSDTDTAIASADATNEEPISNAGGPYTGNVNSEVTFNGIDSDDPDGTISTYSWAFGDGAFGTGVSTTHTYTMAGTYDVSLTVIDNAGYYNRSWTTAAIDSANDPPVADAGGPYGHKVNIPIDFYGGNSNDPDGDIVQYDWDFDDGSTAIDGGPTPSHAYATTGVYDVALTVTDDGGATAIMETKAYIGDGVNLPPSADPGGPYSGDGGVPIDFNGEGSDDPDGSILQFDWDFGDGNTAINGGPTPRHTYAKAVAGAYLVTLTVADDEDDTDTRTTVAAIGLGNRAPTADAAGPYSGAVDVPVLFNGTASSDSDGSIVQYDWDYGDTNTGSGLFSTHTYTAPGAYTARLTVTDNDGDTDDSTAKVIIGDGAKQAPRADANGPYNAVAGVLLTFDGSNSTDPDGTIDVYSWAFGDGNSATVPTPGNSYVGGGLYSVLLHVTDDDALTASDGTIARIGNFSVPPKATAGVNNEPYKGRVGVPVAFDGSNSTDPDGSVVRYDWDFGDSNVLNNAGPTPTNVYATGGKYLAKLTVTDDSGETDADITVVNVGIGNLPPLANAGDSVSGTVSHDITFDGTGSSDPDGSVANYAWSFGDGNTGTGPNPTHSYAAAGKYFVTLTVTDNDGAIDSDATLVDAEQASGGDSSNGGFCFINTIMGK